MEKKLAEYRARREREAYFNKGKEKMKSILSLPRLKRQQQPNEEEMEARIEEQEKLINDEDAAGDYSEINETEEDKIPCCTPIDIVCYSLSFVIWGMLYAIFIKFQFGTIYLIVSALIFICFNTSTRPRKRNEVSAYSVFNKDCKSIDGTLKAEQLEKEIRFGR